MTDFKTKPFPMQKPTITHKTRPWGDLWLYAHNVECTVSIARCDPGTRLSLQIHSARSEMWIILDDGWVPAGMKHRFGSNGPEVRFMEVGFGNWQQEDIIRLEDDYSRPKEGE